MIRLLKGVFGDWDGYALLGYESVPIGAISGDIVLGGDVDSGGCSFGTASFGSYQ